MKKWGVGGRGGMKGMEREKEIEKERDRERDRERQREREENDFFFFFAFPSYISGVHHFWVRFLRM